jgi:hypothetical protein
MGQSKVMFLFRSVKGKTYPRNSPSNEAVRSLVTVILERPERASNMLTIALSGSQVFSLIGFDNYAIQMYIRNLDEGTRPILYHQSIIRRINPSY